MASNASVSSTRHRRRATLFDAVAGRVNSHGLMPTHGKLTSTHRDTLSSSLVPISPQALLFRHAPPAPTADVDAYLAHRRLPPDVRLPDSELLKAVHVYAADLYARGVAGAMDDVGSCDETALLALGVLLEEAAEACLGEKGGLVFVEGVEGEERGDFRGKEWEFVKNGEEAMDNFLAEELEVETEESDATSGDEEEEDEEAEVELEEEDEDDQKMEERQRKRRKLDDSTGDAIKA